MNDFFADIGGTWTRLRDGGRLERVPTPSKLRHPQERPKELVEQLVQLLSERAPTKANAYISLGAAYDQDADIAYGSGPLWGPGRHNIPFRRTLERRRPDVRWTVVNDVTAALAHFIKRAARPADRHAMYVTISSGIALRTAYIPTRNIAVDMNGLQGEAGHLLATSTANEAIRSLVCECGGRGHIAAISAGPAIPHVAEALNINLREVSQGDSQDESEHSEPDEALLKVIVEPIANLIRTMYVLQPHVDLIGIGGGVPSGIGAPYERELRRQLSTDHSYADAEPTRTPRLHFVSPNEVRPEIGAALIAHGYLKSIK